jgi:putative transposase
MMSDFRDMTNHLLAYALHKRIKSVYDLRDQQRKWFETHYRPKYAVHYLHSTCSYAMGIANSWRKNGKFKLPYLQRPIAKLDQMLVKIKEKTDTKLKLQITIAPRQYVYLDLPIHHKKWKEYSQYKLGEITIHDGYIDLPFQVSNIKRKSKYISGIDLNFNHADIATSKGKIKHVDLSRITQIQQNMKRKRESIQKSIPTNLKKQYLILGKYKNREHNRVNQVILDKSKEISKSVGASAIIFEDLTNISQNTFIKLTKKSKLFKYKLGVWVYNKLQQKTEQYHKYPTYYVYPQGTSSHCAFDGSKVKHPNWNLSVCNKHGTLDRDKNASVNILERGRKYLRGEPFPPSVWQSLFEQSVHDNGRKSKVWHENRNDAMTKDTTNVNMNNINKNGILMSWKN